MIRYAEPVTDLIRRRRSWRSYTREPLSPGHKDLIRDFILSLGQPPFGTGVRLALVDASLPDRKRMPGTYGVIKGAGSILVGALKPSPMDFEDFGYSFEAVILFCTQLGLGTCWMGGTFDRTLFGLMIGLQPGETVPAVSPVGNMGDRRSLVDSLFALGAGSKNRKPFAELFFRGDLSTPLDAGRAGKYGEVLEMVRLAPSAMNKQPWRIVAGDGCFHFFLARSPGYSKLISQADLQRIDMGIAMLHFDLTANSLGLKGSWQRLESSHGVSCPRGTEYRASWVCG